MYSAGTGCVVGEERAGRLADVRENQWLVWIIDAQRADAEVADAAMRHMIESLVFDAVLLPEKARTLLGRIWHHPLRSDLLRGDIVENVFSHGPETLSAILVPSTRWDDAYEREVFINWALIDVRRMHRTAIRSFRLPVVKPASPVFNALLLELAFSIDTLAVANGAPTGQSPNVEALLSCPGMLDEEVVLELTQSPTDRSGDGRF